MAEAFREHALRCLGHRNCASDCSCSKMPSLEKKVGRIWGGMGPKDLSAFWPSFRRIFCRQSLSAGFVCNICLHFGQGSADFLQTKFVCRVVCQGFLCRQTLSAETADKLCLQNLLTKFVCRTAADKLCLHAHEFVCNIHQMTNFVYSRQTLSTV